MNNNKILSCFVSTLLFCVTFLYSENHNDSRIQIPMNPQEEDIVKLDLASKIASATALKNFGEGLIGTPIIGYDLNGNIRAYIIPFRIGKSVFPSESEILEYLKNARQLLPQSKAELAVVRETSLKLKKEEIQFEQRGKKMFLKKNIEWEKAEEKVEVAKNRCWGIGEFATITVSGRKDLYPLLGFSNTLPYYYTYREVAEDMANEVLGSNLSLSCFYYGGPEDQIFEFESSAGTKLWVALFPPRVVMPGDITEKTCEMTHDEKESVTKAWDEVIQEVQNEK